jgi:phospholipase C
MVSLRTVSLILVLVLGAVLTLTLGTPSAQAVRAAGPLDKINNIIEIYQENWSFDGLYSL